MTSVAKLRLVKYQVLETCHCDFNIRLVKCLRKYSSVKFPVNMAGSVLNNIFSQCRKRKLSLESDVAEYHCKHKEADYEDR